GPVCPPPPGAAGGHPGVVAAARAPRAVRRRHINIIIINIVVNVIAFGPPPALSIAPPGGRLGTGGAPGAGRRGVARVVPVACHVRPALCSAHVRGTGPLAADLSARGVRDPVRAAPRRGAPAVACVGACDTGPQRPPRGPAGGRGGLGAG